MRHKGTLTAAKLAAFEQETRSRADLGNQHPAMAGPVSQSG
jgi:hypothetical protein